MQSRPELIAWLRLQFDDADIPLGVGQLEGDVDYAEYLTSKGIKLPNGVTSDSMDDSDDLDDSGDSGDDDPDDDSVSDSDDEDLPADTPVQPHAIGDVRAKSSGVRRE
jgi:hypothetical protein